MYRQLLPLFFKAIFQQSMFDTGGCSTSSPSLVFLQEFPASGIRPNAVAYNAVIDALSGTAEEAEAMGRGRGEIRHYPLVMTNIAMVKSWPIEIDGLPINSMVIFHGYVK